jgi:predicted porin
MRNSLAYAFLLAGFAASAQAADLEENGYRDRLSDTLTWNGVTLYGVIDVGYVYQTHGAPLSGALPTGLEYNAFGAQNLRGPISSVAENGSEQSSVGLKIEEAIGSGWVALGKLESGFNPLSGEIADSCASLGRNNGRNQLISTSNSDGNRCGQALNGLAFGGLSNATYGTLTAGRQDSLDHSLTSSFDPMVLAPAFSLGAAPGTGDPETARWDNSVKYVFQYGGLHATTMYADGGPDTALVNSAYAFNLGGTYSGLSVDMNFTRDRGAISSASFNGNNNGLPCPGAGCPPNFLSGTITDDKTWTIGGKYSVELDGGLKDEVATPKLTLFTGYQYSDQANPVVADQAPAGTTTIGGYILAKVDNQPYEPGSHRIQQTAWAGATYAVAPWAFSIAYYHLSQNAFLTTGSGGATCALQTSNNIATGAIGNKTGSNCPGDYHQGSVLVEYTFSKHLDLYGGVSYSEATGGVASGYINNNTALFLTGICLKF